MKSKTVMPPLFTVNEFSIPINSTYVFHSNMSVLIFRGSKVSFIDPIITVIFFSIWYHSHDTF